MNIKKLISILLLVCMITVSLIACDPASGTDESSTTPQNATTTTPDPNVTTIVKSDMTVGDLEGSAVKILAWSDAPNLEFEYDDSNVDQATINDAILQRNINVETRLNGKLEFDYVKGNYDNKNVFVTKAESYSNGDENEFVDILAAYSMTTALCSTKGLCANLMNYTKEGSLNFNNPWWPKALVKEAMFDDMLFVCSGDISTNLLWLMQTMYFNKDLLIDYYGEDAPATLYKLASDGEWTMEKFYEYATGVYSDLNNDGKSAEGDQFGYAIDWNGYYDDFYVSAGFKMCERAADGALVISSEWGGEREDTYADTLVEFTLSDDAYLGSGVTAMFTSGKVLFTNNRAKFAKTSRETAEIEYGILPMPKYDSLQENYATNIGFGYTLYSIASTSTQPENAALIIESMAAQSYEFITPVLFEDALKVRYSPEIDDAITFDILRSSLAFNAGMIYCTPLENYPWTVWRSSISAGSTSYSTKIQVGKSKAQGLLDQLILDLKAAGNQK